MEGKDILLLLLFLMYLCHGSRSRSSKPVEQVQNAQCHTFCFLIYLTPEKMPTEILCQGGNASVTSVNLFFLCILLLYALITRRMTTIHKFHKVWTCFADNLQRQGSFQIQFASDLSALMLLSVWVTLGLKQVTNNWHKCGVEGRSSSCKTQR